MTNDNPRGPRSFSLDDIEGAPKPKPVTKAKAKTARKPRAAKTKAVLTPVPDDAAQRVDLPSTTQDLAEQLTPPPPTSGSKKRFGWGRLFWLALAGLVSLAIGLWIDQFIRDLFSRQDWLGWLAVGLTALLVLAVLVIVARELLGLRRMEKIDALRHKATNATLHDDPKAAKAVIGELLSLYDKRPDTSVGRAELAAHAKEIIDGSDLIGLAERDLLKPLDEKARSLVMGSAKRVSVVTAVSPRAVVDLAFVLLENVRLIRRLADLYGGRPGTLGFWRLTRNVIAHLAVTGSIAIGDGLVQQVVGHGLAARISSRLGEGVINGLLTSRIGIAAIDVCRPLPFTDQTRPSVKDFMGELVQFSGKEADGKSSPE